MKDTSASTQGVPIYGETGVAAVRQLGQPFNPFHLFHGVFVPDALVRYRGLNPTSKFLWARLARYAGRDGRAYPSVPTLAMELGLSDRQVQRGLALLERERFIRRDLQKTKKGDFTSNNYVFLWHPILADATMTRAEDVAKPSPKTGVVTHVSPRGEQNVTTIMKRRLEEKTSSSPLAPTPLSPTPFPNVRKSDDERPSEKAELIDLILRSTGQGPDRRLVRDITEGLELRGISLREYLNDIRPRLGRLKGPPRPGFFRHHMSAWSEALPAQLPPQSASHARCTGCRGIGKTAQGYCTCEMGRELAKVEKRTAEERTLQEKAHDPLQH